MPSAALLKISGGAMIVDWGWLKIEQIDWKRAKSGIRWSIEVKNEQLECCYL
jgi:hypothetical protein